MTIQEQISVDLKKAILIKDENTKSILRVLIGEFNRIDKTVSDDQAISIIKKMVQNATDQNHTTEATILEAYLPKQLTLEELRDIVSNLAITNRYTSIKDMGKIMSELKISYGGRYDGKLANEVVKSVLA